MRLFALLVYTFGVFAYGAMLALWAGAVGRLGWGARQTRDAGVSREVDWLNGALLAVSFLWFLCNQSVLLTSLTPRERLWQLDVVATVLAFCFPPLIMHLSWATVASAEDARVSAVWRLALWPAYAICAVIPLGRFRSFSGRPITLGISSPSASPAPASAWHLSPRLCTASSWSQRTGHSHDRRGIALGARSSCSSQRCSRSSSCC